MTLISKNVYIDKLADIINEYSNTYHSAIKMNPVDVKSNIYIDFNLESNDKDSKFEVGDHVRYPNTETFLEKVLKNGLKKVLKNTVPGTYVIEDLNREEIVGTFY